ncbi:MAG: DUF5946 family protein [Mycobacteriaceae bacterium]|uniref:DUF5946 family protein n=1 Tax=Corynebacterium sp. TaxID=1720 RepID=UPI003F9B89AE
MNPTTTCPECGAGWENTTCTGYFHELLALDHQRLQPWGRFHGLNVACYLLQHPSQLDGARQHDQLGALWQMLTVYLTEGIDGVNALERQRVEGGIPSFDAPSGISVPERVRTPSVTIKDVAAERVGVATVGAAPGTTPGADTGPGGMFPARGFEDRMHLWVLSIAAERGLGS